MASTQTSAGQATGQGTRKMKVGVAGLGVGANAVVIKSVPPNSTVVGVPGRVTWREGKRVEDTCDMDIDYTNLVDPLSQTLDKIEQEIQKIEDELKDKKPKA